MREGVRRVPRFETKVNFVPSAAVVVAVLQRKLLPFLEQECALLIFPPLPFKQSESASHGPVRQNDEDEGCDPAGRERGEAAGL
ncbi:unnamed protein product [Boreogadus saida]